MEWRKVLMLKVPFILFYLYFLVRACIFDRFLGLTSTNRLQKAAGTIQSTLSLLQVTRLILEYSKFCRTSCTGCYGTMPGPRPLSVCIFFFFIQVKTLCSQPGQQQRDVKEDARQLYADIDPEVNQIIRCSNSHCTFLCPLTLVKSKLQTRSAKRARSSNLSRWLIYLIDLVVDNLF